MIRRPVHGTSVLVKSASGTPSGKAGLTVKGGTATFGEILIE